MSKALSFIRLDFQTVKPYFTGKNLLLLLVVGAFVGFGTGTPATIIGIVMVYGIIYASYPFAVGEQNGIDALYCTLALGRDTVVVGRYLFVLCMNIGFGLMATLLSFIISLVSGAVFNWVEAFATVAASFCIFSLVLCIQLPLFFKLGYSKAKAVTYLPLLGFPALVLLVSRVGKTESIDRFFTWLEANATLACIIGVGVVLLCLALSCEVSIRFYRKRDF